jgi:hypothetical protein
MWCGARLPSVCIRKSHTTPVRTTTGIGKEQKDDLAGIAPGDCRSNQHLDILLRAKRYSLRLSVWELQVNYNAR